MQALELQLHGDNDDEILLEISNEKGGELEGHPIFDTPFVKDLLLCNEDEDEGNDQEQGEKIVVSLPDNFQRDSVVQFCNHLLQSARSGELMEFGKYYGLTYKQVYRMHYDYVQWGRRQASPSRLLKAFLKWAEFADNGYKADNPEACLPIAKFFQIDLCSRCGRLGGEGLILEPCHRTKWPTVPTKIPIWEDVVKGMNDEDMSGKLKAMRDAWKAAEIDREANGKFACSNDDLLCENCICPSTLGCFTCKLWECESCVKDIETPDMFEKWRDHFGDDGDNTKEYPSLQSLDVRRCLACGSRSCCNCGSKCIECDRRACQGCRSLDDLNPACYTCIIRCEDGDDEYHGMLDEYICRPCFDRELHYCGCGEPSYDPNSTASNYSDIMSSSSSESYGGLFNHDTDDASTVVSSE